MEIYIKSARIKIVASEAEVHPEREQVYLMSNASKIWQTYLSFRDGKIIGSDLFAFVVSDVDAVLKELLGYFVLAEAAGGIVTKDGSILFIHRLGKWDLPKGHIEPGETPEQAAVREVAEETGVRAMINQPLQDTWHTYQRHGSDWIKKTYWYDMTSTNDLNAKPQVEEGIEEVRWIPIEDVEQKVIPFTYDSLIPVLRAYVADALSRP